MHPENRGERRRKGFIVAHKVAEYYSGECVGIYRKTRTFCSNPMCCGNPRRIRGRNKLAMQERRAEVPNAQ